MKLTKILLGIATGFILLIVSLGLINYYVYCWTSFLPIVGFDYKSIEFIYEKQNNPFTIHEVLEDYDLVKIGNELKSKSDYQIGDNLDEHTLFVTRKFNDVTYSIYIGKTKPGDEHFTAEFSHFVKQRSPEKSKFELPTTPDFHVRQNLERMIDEMPLNEAQNKELKIGIRINHIDAEGRFRINTVM